MRAPISIRPLTQADAPLLWSMLPTVLYVPPGAPPLSPDVIRQPEIARYVAGWMRPGDFGQVAEVDGRPVGVAWLRQGSETDPGYGFVDADTPELAMAVEAEHRERGIGTALLCAVLDATSARTVSLSVSAENPACRLYRRLGFETVGDAEAETLTMVRRLSP